jgi:hypothetical protein
MSIRFPGDVGAEPGNAAGGPVVHCSPVELRLEQLWQGKEMGSIFWTVVNFLLWPLRSLSRILSLEW